jgi:hypothetical protein
MRHLSLIIASLILAATAVLAAPAMASEARSKCGAPHDETRLYRPLPHVSALLRAHQPIRIVAIGSSSTAGAGASGPAASYPARLQAELHERFPGQTIEVINHGVNGDTAEDMLARFDKDVIAEKPDLVLWQVGSNSILRDHPVLPEGGLLREGIRMIRAAGADVVLIDPQFSPKIIEKHDASEMVGLIDTTARDANVGVFHRFAIMRYWREQSEMRFFAFVPRAGFNMNDWGYGCWAKLLGAALAEAATRPTASANAAPAR